MEFYSKNKFEKSVHIVGFIMWAYILTKVTQSLLPHRLSLPLVNTGHHTAAAAPLHLNYDPPSWFLTIAQLVPYDPPSSFLTIPQLVPYDRSVRSLRSSQLVPYDLPVGSLRSPQLVPYDPPSWFLTIPPVGSLRSPRWFPTIPSS